MHASPRGLSQLAASFVAFCRQGIRHPPKQPGRLEFLGHARFTVPVRAVAPVSITGAFSSVLSCSRAPTEICARPAVVLVYLH